MNKRIANMDTTNPDFGHTVDKIKATDVLWDFFQKHPAPARP